MSDGTAIAKQWNAIGAIYDAAMDTSRSSWIHALSQISAALGSVDTVVLAVQRRRVEFTDVIRFGVDEASAFAFESYYASRDPVLAPAMQHAQPGEIFFSNELIADTTLQQTEFYTDFLHPLQRRHGAMALLTQHGSSRAVLHLAREAGAASFERRLDSALVALLPHLQRAVQLTLRLAAPAHAGVDGGTVLDRLRDPLLLVDAEARVVYANASAERLLSSQDGLALERSTARGGGRLRVEGTLTTASLRSLIANASRTAKLTISSTRTSGPPSATDASGGLMLLHRPSGKPPLVALVSPYRAASVEHTSPFAILHSEMGGASAMVSIIDPSDASRNRGVHGLLLRTLCARFALTPAEAAVAIAIADGDGLATVAVQREVSLATVRSQALRIYDKTGVRGQAALARLVSRLREQLGHFAKFE